MPVSIPLEQVRVFRQRLSIQSAISAVSIPLEQGRVFRLIHVNYKDVFMRLNPFGTGRVKVKLCRCPVCHRFQSLWNRSGSFDFMYPLQPADLHQVSIPLEQGKVFRRNNRTRGRWIPRVSIPLEQGKVFRQANYSTAFIIKSVSIPLEQGKVFRPNTILTKYSKKSQSLWNRAGSFDAGVNG